MGRFTKEKKQETGSQEYGKVESFRIANPRNGKYGVRFTLELNGVCINGCTVRESKEGVEFLALPNYKGSDGRYYNHVFFRFSPEDTEMILKELEKQLKEQ